MSTVLPPAPPTLPPSAAATGPVSVTVTSGQTAIQLVEGALMQAVAQARAAKGLITVSTAAGLLELKAALPLPPIPAGAKLLFQVQGSGAEAQLSLIAINGRGLGGLPIPGLASPPPGGAVMAGPASPNTPPAVGHLAAQPTIITGAASAESSFGFTATLIRPAAQAGALFTPLPPALAAAGIAPDMPAGTQLTVRLADIGTPMASTQPAQPAAPQAAPVAQVEGKPAVQSHPAVPLPAAAPPSPAPMLPGLVTAQSPGGTALVQTPVGTLTLTTPMELPAGTPVTLEVVGRPVPPAPPTFAAPPAAPGLTTQGWPAMTQALDVLATTQQTQAMEELLRVLPQQGPRLAAAMMAFTGAIQAGEPRKLVTEPVVKGLEKAGKKDLADRLRADLEALGEDAGRPVGNGEWRGYTMPFLQQGAIDPIRLFVRATGEEQGSARRAGGTGNDQRFVLDLNLSHLGRLQLDGLVRREDKLFDLIIRTGEALPREACRDILGIFTSASELVGTRGSVSFQSGGRWVEFPPDPPPPTRIEA